MKVAGKVLLSSIRVRKGIIRYHLKVIFVLRGWAFFCRLVLSMRALNSGRHKGGLRLLACRLPVPSSRSALC